MGCYLGTINPHFTADYWYQLHLITSLLRHIHTVKWPLLDSLFRSQTCTTLVEVAGFYSANTYVDCITRFMYIVLVLSWLRNQMETFSALLAFVRGIHRWPVNCPHKGQWRGALICARINGWVNKREGGDLRRYRAHYNATTMTDETLNAIPHGRHDDVMNPFPHSCLFMRGIHGSLVDSTHKKTNNADHWCFVCCWSW